METTRILWSGGTGRTGQAAIEQARRIDGVEIVAGMKRQVSGADDFHLRGETFENVDWLSYETEVFGLGGLIHLVRQTDIDVFVDFSHKDATNRIPVFRGGNFRFKVKKFIDKAVELAKTANGNLTLYENFYEGKSLPSETSKVVKKRIEEATGKTIEVYSLANLPKDNLPCNWKLDLGTEMRNCLECNTVGFDELAHDVLEIAKVMAKKPVKRGEFYDLDEIWDDIPEVAKPK